MNDINPSSPDAPLGRRAAQSAMFIGAAQILRLAFSTLSTIIVSHILSPDDYGVVAMASPVAGFILLFQDLGLGQAVIQARTMTAEKLNNLFWVNIAASGVIMLVLLLMAPLVGLFYGDPRPAYVTAASTLPVLISGIALQHNALLNRNMRFGVLAAADIASAITTFIVTIIAALLLRNYWSLLIGSLFGTIAMTVLLIRGDPWRPTLNIRFGNVGEEARFGGNLTGFNLINFLCRNLDNVLIARFSGTVQLGLYDRSYKLMMLPLQNINGPLTKVMMPVLSRLQDKPVEYRRAFLIAYKIMLLAATPLIVVTAATSDRIITFLLGDQWTQAAPIFFWLSLAGLLQPIGNATGWLFISSGNTNGMLRWSIFSGILTIGGFVIGLPWGAVGVAASLFISSAARLPLLFPYSRRGTSVRTIDLYAALAVPALGGLLTTIFARLMMASALPFWLLLIILLPFSYAVTLGLYALRRDDRVFLSKLSELALHAIGPLGRRLRRENHR